MSSSTLTNHDTISHYGDSLLRTNNLQMLDGGVDDATFSFRSLSLSELSFAEEEGGAVPTSTPRRTVPSHSRSPARRPSSRFAQRSHGNNGQRRRESATAASDGGDVTGSSVYSAATATEEMLEDTRTGSWERDGAEDGDVDSTGRLSEAVGRQWKPKRNSSRFSNSVFLNPELFTVSTPGTGSTQKRRRGPSGEGWSESVEKGKESTSGRLGHIENSPTPPETAVKLSPARTTFYGATPTKTRAVPQQEQQQSRQKPPRSPGIQDKSHISDTEAESTMSQSLTADDEAEEEQDEEDTTGTSMQPQDETSSEPAISTLHKTLGKIPVSPHRLAITSSLHLLAGKMEAMQAEIDALKQKNAQLISENKILGLENRELYTEKLTFVKRIEKFEVTVRELEGREKEKIDGGLAKGKRTEKGAEEWERKEEKMEIKHRKEIAEIRVTAKERYDRVVRSNETLEANLATLRITLTTLQDQRALDAKTTESFVHSASEEIKTLRTRIAELELQLQLTNEQAYASKIKVEGKRKADQGIQHSRGETTSELLNRDVEEEEEDDSNTELTSSTHDHENEPDEELEAEKKEQHDDEEEEEEENEEEIPSLVPAPPSPINAQPKSYNPKPTTTATTIAKTTTTATNSHPKLNSKIYLSARTSQYHPSYPFFTSTNYTQQPTPHHPTPTHPPAEDSVSYELNSRINNHSDIEDEVEPEAEVSAALDSLAHSEASTDVPPLPPAHFFFQREEEEDNHEDGLSEDEKEEEEENSDYDYEEDNEDDDERQGGRTVAEAAKQLNTHKQRKTDRKGARTTKAATSKQPEIDFEVLNSTLGSVAYLEMESEGKEDRHHHDAAAAK